MSRALIATYSGEFGGSERVLVDCALALEGAAVLACPEGELARRARAAGIQVLALRAHPLERRGSPRARALGPLHLAAHGHEVRELVASLEPGVLVCWGMRSALAMSLGMRVAVPIAFQHNDFLPGGAVARLVRRAAARAAVVIVPSRAVAADLATSTPTVVVAPGVDVSRFAPGTELAVPFEVAVVGALVRWKRPELALEVLRLVRESGADVRLRLIGSALDPGDPTPRRLQARTRELGLEGAVDLVGRTEYPEEELGRAGCLLHCAEREPFGLVVLEAMAAARPVVVPSAAGPLEIADETCGAMYPPGDAHAAASAIAELAADPGRARTMGTSGRRRAEAEFSLERMRAQFAEAVGRARGPVGGNVAATAGAEISVVTVTHDSEAELRLLLASLRRWLPGAEVVVVDSGSADAGVDVARAAGARVVELDENVGFGRASNRGLAEVGRPVTLLLNPDVELLDSTPALLADELFRREGPERILAPLVLRPDGRREASAHPVPSSPADLALILASPALLPRPLGEPVAPWRSRRPRRAGWAVGCALAARTDTLRALGPFDDSIFMYGEDLDLGLRAARSGVETWFWPQARVLHGGAHASLRAFGGEPFARLAAARHEVVRRRLGRRRAGLDLAAQAATFATRIAVKRALGRTAERERSQLRAVLSLRDG